MKNFDTLKLFAIICLTLCVLVSCKSKGKVKGDKPARVEIVVKKTADRQSEPPQTNGGQPESQKPENQRVENRPVSLNEEPAAASNGGVNSLSDNQIKNMEKMEQFSFRLLSKIDSVATGNYVISPVSVDFLLAMLLNGAEGETAEEISNLLGFEAKNFPSINSMYQTLMQMLPEADPKVNINIANAMVFNRNISLQSQFVKSSKTYYNAEISNMDFRNSDAVVKKINTWCSDQTNGLIPKIIDKVTPDMSACLMNAVYFKGAWREPFKPSMTSKKNFTGENNLVSSVDMMVQQGRFHYGETDDAQWLSLPYGNGRYCMYLMLPKSGVKVSDVVKSLSPEYWAQALGSMRSHMVNVWLPKFETKYHISLNSVMKDLGMVLAFTPSADFSGISKIKTYISAMQQDAIIKVYEEGSEAAAVTSAIMKATSVAMPPKPVAFHADHPFLYFIVEEQSGCILFAGRYNGEK